jgi:hypothetical protein
MREMRNAYNVIIGTFEWKISFARFRREKENINVNMALTGTGCEFVECFELDKDTVRKLLVSIKPVFSRRALAWS